MDLSRWLKVYDLLLPRSRAWGLLPGKTLTKLFEAFAGASKEVQDHIAGVLAEMFPSTTTYPRDWSKQLGSLIDLDEDELAAELAAQGGQNPNYMQTQIQSICSNCFVHEWWVPGSNPPEARNPIPLVDSSLVLVNDVTDMVPNYKYQFGDGTGFVDNSLEDPIEFGDYDGYIWRLKQYPCPDIPEEYPIYWYVGGETWPDYAYISSEKLRPLIRMIFKIKPVHTRVVLRVLPYQDGDPSEDPTGDDFDLQNVTYATEPDEYQTVLTATDEEIQNYS
jgi:hypothetical protein